MCRAFESTVTAGQGPWEMLPSEQLPAPHPNAALWSFRKGRWAEETLAFPSAASLGRWGKSPLNQLAVAWMVFSLKV